MTGAPATKFNRAIVRRPAPSVVDGLRAGDGENPTYDGVGREHDAYVAALGEAGVKVSVLPALEAFPDSHFCRRPGACFSRRRDPFERCSAEPCGRGGGACAGAEQRCISTPCLKCPSDGFADGGDILTTRDKVIIRPFGAHRQSGRRGTHAVVADVRSRRGNCRDARRAFCISRPTAR